MVDAVCFLQHCAIARTLNDVLNATRWIEIGHNSTYNHHSGSLVLRCELSETVDVPLEHLDTLELRYQREADIFWAQIQTHRSLSLIPNLPVYGAFQPGMVMKIDNCELLNPDHYTFNNSFMGLPFDTPYVFIHWEHKCIEPMQGVIEVRMLRVITAEDIPV